MTPLFSHPAMRRFFFLFLVGGIGQNGFAFVTNLSETNHAFDIRSNDHAALAPCNEMQQT
jgi:hypothetical protein